MNTGWVLAGALWLLTGACSGEPAPEPPPLAGDGLAGDVALMEDAALADTLRRRIEDAYDFSRPGLAERMSALYPGSPSVVSAAGGRLVVGADSIRAGIAAFWENTGRNMTDARWTWGEVHVTRLAPDAAVLTATWSIPHIAPTGRPHVIEGAWTAVFRRQGGTWLIVAEHLSTPGP